jgi:hypothetical protein
MLDVVQESGSIAVGQVGFVGLEMPIFVFRIAVLCGAKRINGLGMKLPKLPIP